MIEFSASVVLQSRHELEETITEARRQLAADKPVDALMSLRWIGETLTGKPVGDSLWPGATFGKLLTTLLRAVQEEAPRGGEAIVRLRDSFLSFKELEEHRARRRDRMLSAPAHEIKALISLVEAHAVYLIDEYAYLMRSREQSSSQNASLTA